MRTFVSGSRLVSGIQIEKDRFKVGLCQDRYATRCSQQWMGPQLEDLMLAHTQVTTELNSTSDNPLVDVSQSDIHSGGNFQAASITSAMEKTRLLLQMIGKMLSSQYTELINPAFNNGLPANLAADDPSLSFTMKGIDVNMAGYMSELACVANPVSNHVQSAEQHNQAINSLAFISARYTMDAVDLVSLISASFIYVGCQALDLRVMHKTFLDSFKPTLEAASKAIGSFLPPSSLATLQQNIWKNVTAVWYQTGSFDALQRCENVIATSISILSSGLIVNEGPTPSPMCSVAALEEWRCHSYTAMHQHFISFRDKFFEKQNTVDYLGQASKKVYKFVRGELGVPFHRILVEHPIPGDIESNVISGREKKTIGSWVGIIHESLRDGRLGGVVMEALVEGLDVSEKQN
jgi:phenylalanine ammonia-lyase